MLATRPAAPILQSPKLQWAYNFQEARERMNKDTALQLLGLEPDATPETITTRYAQATAFFDPDRQHHAKLQDLVMRASLLLTAAYDATDITRTETQEKKQTEPTMERTKTEHWQAGAEVLIESATGKRKLDDESPVLETFDSINDLTLKGKYMALTFRRLLLNVPLKSKYSGDIKRFTLVELLFQNVWDYPLNAMSSAKMIDTEGFQHGDDCESYEFDHAIQNGKTIPVSFPEPESPLEDHAKTKGWIWFDELQNGVLPQRFIFAINIFEPGHTSGWVKNTEVLEFFIKSCSTSAAKLK
jgi:hypothetical protein